MITAKFPDHFFKFVGVLPFLNFRFVRLPNGHIEHDNFRSHCGHLI